ncbi:MULTISPECIES: DUF4347 domain-containing protein [Cyanophyceae]|uniref:DUF4347 domain-containing protein n=1 Tax=Cyanophyceae TaxID=3028117 RepID=UPI001682D8B9|nr:MULTISPECIES: DUF4347 domain-containing protein [Cyanophyceae]MBD1914725.1 DUF4347 domain-containing protein [Phormidium sp. FACHB-77]MBD2030828.1 DUF4347 domain-containing protein [Phormidium sp. FACHB-322]MBD2052427.1 DUF4347 domain-containing protein [Leptolyngbya sp. FACHB-60]
MFQNAQSVVFIDANVSDVQHLVNGALPGVAVKVLAADVDGIAQITNYLEAYPVSTVHIVSHGAPGILYLGNTELNLTNLENHAQALQSWFSPQISNPTLLLYGCNVAAGDAGEEFVRKLQDLTGANLAASRQVVGQGYWSLEVSPTNITALPPFSTTVLTTWAGELAHFRGGQIAWIPNDTDGDGINDDALITVKTAWAQNSVNPISSLGNLTGITQTLVSNSIVNIATTNTGTYSFQTTLIQANNFDPNTAYTGNYSGGVRISNLLNNSNGSWNIQSTFFLADGNRAPQIDFPIIADVPKLDASGSLLPNWTYALSVVDPDGDDVRYRLANSTELGGGVNPSGFSIDSSTGLLTWTGSGSLAQGLYSAGLVVEDLDSSGNVKSKSHVDFVLNLANLRAALVDVNGDVTESQTTVNLGAKEIINFSFDGGVTAQALSNSNGALTGTSPAFSYNAGTVGAGVYPVTFRVSQAGFADSYKTYNFVVADLSAPAIAGIGGDIVTWGRDPVAIDAGGNATVSYAGGSDLNGGFLRINPAFVDVGELVQVNNQGTGNGQISVSGSNVLYEGQLIGTIDATENGNGKALLINFTTAAATPEAIEALIHNITYTNGTAGEPTDGNRSISIVLSDGSISNNYTSNVDVAHIHNFPPTGTVTISGTAEQGFTLTASNNLSDPDGLGSITYTWFANGFNTGVAGPTYQLTQADVSKVLTVQASYTDVFGTPEAVTSAPTSAVTNVNDSPTGGVTIDGTIAQGQVLTANTSTLADADGLGTLTYQWQQSTDGITWTTIARPADTSTLTPTQAQVGQFVRSQVSYTDGGGTAESVFSNATATKVTNVNDAPTGGVTIDGIIAQGQILTANTSTLADADGLGTLSYQWKQSTDGITWNNIDGATGVTFSPRNAQVNQLLQVAVSYVDGQGTSELLTSVLTPTNDARVEQFNATSDFNGDGSVDIFWRHQNVGQSAVFWLMDNVNFAGGDFLSPAVTDVNWDIKALGDLNGDGKPDLVWQNKATNQAAVWLMDGVNLTSGALLPNDAAAGWKVVESSDFNSNGKDDILWRNSNTGELAVWLMDGTDFVSGEFITLNAGLDWEVGAVGDFTNDGKTDIFWENRITGANAFWEMDGTTFVEGYLTTTADASWKAKGAADFNQDGNLDLLWHNPGTGENALWLMDGTNLIETVTTLPTTDVSWNPVV